MTGSLYFDLLLTVCDVWLMKTFVVSSVCQHLARVLYPLLLKRWEFVLKDSGLLCNREVGNYLKPHLLHLLLKLRASCDIWILLLFLFLHPVISVLPHWVLLQHWEVPVSHVFLFLGVFLGHHIVFLLLAFFLLESLQKAGSHNSAMVVNYVESVRFCWDLLLSCAIWNFRKLS